jgi:hypothetical protein
MITDKGGYPKIDVKMIWYRKPNEYLCTGCKKMP